MKRSKVKLLLALGMMALLASCNYLIDSSRPKVSISPSSGNIQSSTMIKVTASDGESGIKSIELFVNGKSETMMSVPAEEIVQGAKTLEYPLDMSNMPNGTQMKLSAKAINGFGRSSDMAEVTLTVAGPTSSNPNVPGPSPTVSIDPALIEPGALTPKPSGCDDSTGNGCFGGTVNVLVRAAAPVGSNLQEIILTIDSKVSGTSTKTLTDFPARFDVDTSGYPNNDVLTLSAKAVTEEDGVGTSNDVSLTVFNPAPPPALAITGPAGGSEVAGLLDIDVSVSQLSNSGYTLDLDQSGTVSGQEGFHVELIDFTGRIVEEFYMNSDYSSLNVNATRSGSYTARSAMDSTEYANDTYTIRVSLPALFNNGTGTTDDDITVTLVRSVVIDTNNKSRVAPSLLILSPTDEDLNAIKTIRDPTDAFISVQATDNGGLAFIELRIYEGDPVEDATPSRYVYYSDNKVAEKVALPIRFNANPYLSNAEYTARVIAQDGEGNRSFQDLKVKLERVRGQDADYSTAQTGPREPIEDEDGNITGYGGVMTTVPVNTQVSLGTFSTEGGETYDHFVQSPGDYMYRPLFTSTSSGSYDTGLSQAGTYYFITQVTTADGDVYLTNSTAISAKDDENQ